MSTSVLMFVHWLWSQIFLYNINHLHSKFFSWDLRNTEVGTISSFLCLNSLSFSKTFAHFKQSLCLFPCTNSEICPLSQLCERLKICAYFKINEIIINLHYIKSYTPIWQGNWKQILEVLIPSHHLSPYELSVKHFCSEVSCKPITYLVSFILCFTRVLWSARFSLSNWGRKKML